MSDKVTKADKEQFIVDTLNANGHTITASELEGAMRKKFGSMNVSARFRQETANLIKEGVLKRDGTGGDAVFKLLKRKKRVNVEDGQKASSAAVAKPAASTASTPDPVPAPPAVVEFDRVWIKNQGEKVLAYLALQGTRPAAIVLKKALNNEFSYTSLGQFVLMGERGLVSEGPDGLSITKEGRKCLDAVRAGENFR